MCLSTLRSCGLRCHARSVLAQAPSATFARASFQAETRGMAFVLQLHKRRRMVGKQPPPAHAVLPAAACAALADEAWSELTALSEDSRRKHVHWVHVRTQNPEHRQPDSFSREGFWQHLCRVYADTYPRPENPSGSILLFGVVAKERHAGPCMRPSVRSTIMPRAIAPSSITGSRWHGVP